MRAETTISASDRLNVGTRDLARRMLVVCARRYRAEGGSAESAL